MAIVPALLFVAIGWTRLVGDRQAALQQIHDRPEQAADLIVASLEQRLAATEQGLGNAATLGAIADTDDAVLVGKSYRSETWVLENFLPALKAEK